MNISRSEQRVLHVLAQGGYVRHERAANGRILEVICFNRDGHVLADCTLEVFAKLRQKRLIASNDSKPYRISELGRKSVRAQLNNR